MNGILFVHPSDELYGADRVALSIAEIATRFCDVTAWIPTDIAYRQRPLTSAMRSAGVRVDHVDYPVIRRDYFRPGMLSTYLRRYNTASRSFAAKRPRLVYLNTSATLFMAQMAKRNGARTIFHLHENWSVRERALLGPMLRYADVIVAVSDAVKSTLPKRAADRALTIPNGFDLQRKPLRSDDPLRCRLGVGRGDILVLLASRWNSWKGHEAFLRAWDQVDRPDMHLVILGGPPPSGEAFDVHAAVRRLSHPGRVHVIGEVADASDWIAASNVVVVPSVRPDPLPTIAIEAAGAARAVFASDLGGLPTIVDQGASGLLLPPLDASAWVDALRSTNLWMLEQQGAEARAVFEKRFSKESFVEAMSSVLDLALSRE